MASLKRRYDKALRGLGHNPKWGSDRNGNYAVCQDCTWAVGGEAVSEQALAEIRKWTPACSRRRP